MVASLPTETTRVDGIVPQFTDSRSLLSWRIDDDISGVRLLTLHRPPWNSMGLREWQELSTILDLPTPAALMFYGGPTLFSSGSEERAVSVVPTLPEPSETLRQACDDYRLSCYDTLATLSERIPTVAALTGYTIGTAWELISRCRYRVMGDNGRLAHQLDGPFIGPEEAQEKGYIDAVVPPDDVWNRAFSWTQEMTS